MKAIALSLVLCAAAYGQLVTNPQAIPRTLLPPVLFLNGYQASCTGTTFAGTFGSADQVMQRAGRVSLFFDNCSIPNRPSIEDLGDRLGEFLRGLKYSDGTAVPQVDIVAHSMGGLITRSYLSGKKNELGVFAPPAETRIRRIVFLATPHFGTPTAALTSDRQSNQLTLGNRFVFDLATWNQGSEDLRGIEAISLIGDAGLGVTNTAKFDDSVTSLTSGSIEFIQPGRTRVLPYCHTTITTVFGFRICPDGSLGIAAFTDDTHLSARAVISFLTGNSDWQSVGASPAQNSFLSAEGGVIAARTDGTQLTAIESATIEVGTPQALSIRDSTIAYRERATAGDATIRYRSGGADRTKAVTLRPGAVAAVNLTDVPVMLPAAARVTPLTLAPGMFVAIYGVGLAPRTEVAPALPFPLVLAETRVLANDTAIPLYFVSTGQINAVLPENVSGRVRFTVRRTGSPDQVFHALIEAAVPAIFTANGAGTGLASALNAVTGQVVTAQNSIARGEFLALYLTGLGATASRDGLDWALSVPAVTVGGKPCAVTYAGRAPGYAGLDQINCQIAADAEIGSAVNVFVQSAGRTSNVATLPVR